MPFTTKDKLNKDDIVSIIRELFVTKEDAEYIYEKIHNTVLQSLADGKVVNLFGCAFLEAKYCPEKIIKNAFGMGDRVIEERFKIVAKVYPTLKKEWKIIQE